MILMGVVISSDSVLCSLVLPQSSRSSPSSALSAGVVSLKKQLHTRTHRTCAIVQDRTARTCVLVLVEMDERSEWLCACRNHVHAYMYIHVLVVCMCTCTCTCVLCVCVYIRISMYVYVCICIHVFVDCDVCMWWAERFPPGDKRILILNAKYPSGTKPTLNIVTVSIP